MSTEAYANLEHERKRFRIEYLRLLNRMWAIKTKKLYRKNSNNAGLGGSLLKQSITKMLKHGNIGRDDRGIFSYSFI